MALISAAVPLPIREELEKLAAENDRSLSSEIRRGLREYLEALHRSEAA
jgi:hypothetical protein